jgi:hypothetical protein
MKTGKKSSLLIGSIITFMIVAIPYLLYLSQGIPSDLESLETIFGTVQGGYYGSVQGYVYWFFEKLVPLALLIIWFITNRNWWVHAIIIPITVYLFQLISVMNDSVAYVDEVEFIYTVPIAVIIMVILYFIRSKMSIYIDALDLKREMELNMKTPKKIE